MKASEVEYDFAVDTAGSWDGRFPSPGKGDYLVCVECNDGDTANILVSRRYVPASSKDDAESLALSAYAERRSIPVDRDGAPSPDVCIATVHAVGNRSARRP